MKLSPEELRKETLTPETFESAVKQIALDGYVTFESVLPRNFVDELHASVSQRLGYYLETSPETVEVNTKPFRKNRVRMDLPFEYPFIDPQIITHPLILPIIEEILGDDCQCFYLACDAPLPGSDYQVVHSDAPPLFPHSSLTLPPVGIVVNIPLIDVREENGPMEIWPGGTHLMPENLNKPEHIEQASQEIQPKRVLTPVGSLLLRDLRMWHRGSPNHSNVIRPNLALIYARSWWRGDHYSKIRSIPRVTYDALSERAKRLFRYIEITDEPVPSLSDSQ